MAHVNGGPEELIPQFRLERVLNQDQAGRRTALHGRIGGEPAVMIVERAPFPSSEAYLGRLPRSLAGLRTLGANDVYSWSMARAGADDGDDQHDEARGGDGFFADLKINLIYPCTEAHVKKYSRQRVRFVTETPEIYRDLVRPYMQSKRDEGRLNWVFNIIEGRTEVDDVIYRTELGRTAGGDEGFLLLPDLNWDRSTLDALHLLALVERRDLWSLRDLKKKHIPWLQHMKSKVVSATVETYPSIEADQLKLYVHYQPTYYHFHIHVVHVALEAGATQATGKAVGLDSIIETLKVMAGDDEAGMDALCMTYTLGEASELWTEVYEPLKKNASGTASQ
ncbi:hypothetical protein E4U42_003433 [Claviceps africana]|uniref:M7GpppX diphosphatase n=1 Tax=Claviceps africana TaxID=83212 RepID=A0A8K0NIV3_9HYPO|nr:hypothetical protein E4U42_003433 [Claviceps africana]